MALALKLPRFVTGAIVAAILSFGFSASLRAQIVDSERQALIDLYNSTDGPNWTNNSGWLGAAGTECAWFGVFCTPGSPDPNLIQQVLYLELGNNKLHGPLPASISHLQKLSSLNLVGNSLTGIVPPLTGLDSIDYISVSRNSLTGALPSLAGLPLLQKFYADYNNLTGSFPELPVAGQLSVLSLGFNEIAGPIPDLSGQTNLSELYLMGNQFTGSIPSLGALANLSYAQFDGNLLTGQVPSLSGLAALRQFSAAQNRLTGQIPALLGVPSLRRLWLDHNQLVGSIPDLSEAPSLQDLYLSQNALSGALPRLDVLPNLRMLVLSENQLSGSIPELAGCPRLEQLWLNENQFSGPIPPINGLTALQVANFSANRIVGGVPDVSGLQFLNLYSLSANQLTGNIPSLQNLPALTTIGLERNRLTGTIPRALFSLASLQDLYLGSNAFDGAVPTEITSASNLQYLDLTRNALHAGDQGVADFINSRQDDPDWREKETLAPTDINALPQGATSIRVAWTPILYQSDPGHYDVLMSRTSGGPYTLAASTDSKQSNQVVVTLLDSSTEYFFIVRSVTDACFFNDNTVVSDPSLEVSATTLPPPLSVDFAASPAFPIAGELVQFESVSNAAATMWSWNFGDPASGSLNAATTPNPSHVYLQPGGYFVTLTVQTASELQEVTHTVVVGSAPGGCSPSATDLCLSAGRFQVSVEWNAEHLGTHGVGTAVPDSSDTGNFWFFSPDAVELVVKIVDGRDVNGHFWVFYGALTNVGYTITIKDTQTGVVKSYVNPQDTLASVSDTLAFSDSGGSSSTVLSTQAAPSKTVSRTIPPSAALTAAPSSPCSADETTLCLKDGRFKVQVTWNALHLGTTGAGHALTLSPDTGDFWFFGSNSIELVVKVVDGSTVNGHFWVFYGALTNVEYTITVTDTETGTVKTYFNPQDSQASVADTSAF